MYEKHKAMDEVIADVNSLLIASNIIIITFTIAFAKRICIYVLS